MISGAFIKHSQSPSPANCFSRQGSTTEFRIFISEGDYLMSLLLWLPVRGWVERKLQGDNKLRWIFRIFKCNYSYNTPLFPFLSRLAVLTRTCFPPKCLVVFSFRASLHCSLITLISYISPSPSTWQSRRVCYVSGPLLFVIGILYIRSTHTSYIDPIINRK